MLNCFLGLLLIILIAEVAVGYLALSNRSKVEDTVKQTAFDALNATKSNDSKLLKEAWNDVQLTVSSCSPVFSPKTLKFDAGTLYSMSIRQTSA